MRCSTRQFLIILFLVGLVLMRESRLAPLNRVEAAFSTWLAANAPGKPEPAPLALVRVTDEDLAAHAWPWSPVDFSIFVNAALSFQPPVIAMEPVLAWGSPDAQGISLLHNQTLRVPKLLLSGELGFPEDPALVPPLQETQVLRHVRGSLAEVREFPLVAAQPGDELRMSAALGYFEPAAAGQTGPVRRVPLIFRYRGQVVPAFPLQAAMLWYGVTPEEVEVVPGSHIALGSAARIPVDEAGTMMVDFAIPMDRFALADLILSAEQSQSGHAPILPVERLKSSLVLLARTDREASTIPLANGRNGSRGELAAVAIATIQRQRFPVAAPVAAELAVIAGALGLGLLVKRLGRAGTAMLCLGTFAVYLLIALGLFSLIQVTLPYVLPAGLLGFILLFRQLD